MKGSFGQLPKMFVVLLITGSMFLTGCSNILSSGNKEYTYEDLTKEQISLLKTSGYDLESGDELDKNQQYILKISAQAEKYLKDKYDREFNTEAVFMAGLMQSYTEFWLVPADNNKVYGMNVSVKATDLSDLSTYTDDYAAYYTCDTMYEKIEDCFNTICGENAEILLVETDCLDWEVFDGSQTPEELIESGVVDFYSVAILSDSVFIEDDMGIMGNEMLDYFEEHGMVGGMHVYLVNNESMSDFNRDNYNTSYMSDKMVCSMNLSLNGEGIRKIHVYREE